MIRLNRWIDHDHDWKSIIHIMNRRCSSRGNITMVAWSRNRHDISCCFLDAGVGRGWVLRLAIDPICAWDLGASCQRSRLRKTPYARPHSAHRGAGKVCCAQGMVGGKNKSMLSKQYSWRAKPNPAEESVAQRQPMNQINRIRSDDQTESLD